MATPILTGLSHLGVTDNQKRWLVIGIALNKILIPRIRPFVEQCVNNEYSNLKASHDIHVQSTRGHLQQWPATCGRFLKYENINGNDVHPRLHGRRFNYSLFDCRVTSHVDFARLYVENYMAKFTAFDDHCDASAVLLLLGWIPAFNMVVQTAADVVRTVWNDWAHCVFSKWDQPKFLTSFSEMEQLVRSMALPTADETELLGELKDWESKGTHLCMNSPVDSALLQLVQQELKSLHDVLDNMSVELVEDKTKVQHELGSISAALEEVKQRVQRLETRQKNLELTQSRFSDFQGNVCDKVMSSAAPSFPSIKQANNYERLCRLLVGVGWQVLRETFDRVRPPGSLHSVLADSQIRAQLNSLEKKRVLSTPQWRTLYPVIKSSVSSATFDSTLLVILLRNICGLVPPATGWSNCPLVTDTTLAADIARIQFYRNTVYRHACNASVDDAAFSSHWKEIKDTLVRLGGACYKDAIDDFENEIMDPEFEGHYQELLRQWVENDNSIEDKLEEHDRVKKQRKLNDLEESKEDSGRRTQIDDANVSQTPAVSAYTEALKASVKSQTEFQPKLVASATISNVRTDDMFTNVLIQHGRKPLSKKVMGETRSDQLQYFGQVSGTPVKHCEEIFIGATNDERSPKRILLTGKAGIGKTLFCQKLVRDWAYNKLFQSQSHFKFVYLLTFRQLNLLENDQLSLQELLNCSTVLDDSSIIDESLFEYILNYPEEVLIIIDGYDEYSQQDYITGKSEERYQNTAKEKMPVAALCTKLINGKLLRDSVVMITSRPDESDKMGGIRFDRFVEIAGFSPQQVQEFIKNYFRENDTMKNVVLDHVMKNENLVSLAHIPMLCFLMCFSMEYALQTSKSADDLPVSTTDIYSEAVNIFELKHSASSQYRTNEIPEGFNASHLVKSTLDKLSELAAKLLLQKKPIFQESDIEENFRLVEIEKLKGSGLLHFGPPFRKSLFETTKYLSFTHMTIHEFLAARWFVMTNVIPDRWDVSEMVLQFIAGILSKKKNGELMEKLLEGILSPIPCSSPSLLLRAKCLSEYQDKEFAKNVIKSHPHHYSRNGELGVGILNDVDCIAISFLLDVFTALNEEEATTAQHQRSEQSFTVNSLNIQFSFLTLSGVKRIVESLEKDSCSVTILKFFNVPLTKCVDCISGLVCGKLEELRSENSGITDNDVASLCDALTHRSCKVSALHLSGNQITDTGVNSLCDALTHPSCKVTTLDLSDNYITDTGVNILCDALKHPSCKVTTLRLGANLITDTGVTSLCDALTHPNCKVTSLDLSTNHITDTGVTSLCDALTHPSCEVNTLDLCHIPLTDTCVTSLCDALKHPSCKVTTLDLSGDAITDTGVSSLCDALKHPSCKVTTLRLDANLITDTGVTSLCDALTHPSCKVTTLDLSTNQITDTDVASLCDALTHPSCEVTTLDLSENMITDTGVTSLCDALKHPSCKVTTLDLSYNHITDSDVSSLCDALKHPSCKVTTLRLGTNLITDTGVNSLCDALKHPSCKVTTLDLSTNQITDTGATSLCEAVQHDKSKLVAMDLMLNCRISEESKQSLGNHFK